MNERLHDIELSKMNERLHDIELSKMNERLHDIELSKLNERLHDMTPNRMFLDVGVSSKKKINKRRNKHLIFIR